MVLSFSIFRFEFMFDFLNSNQMYSKSLQKFFKKIKNNQRNDVVKFGLISWLVFLSK